MARAAARLTDLIRKDDPIVKYDEAQGVHLLRQRSKPVLSVNEDVVELVAHMERIMRAANGVGLAAPQLGILQRIFRVRRRRRVPGDHQPEDPGAQGGAGGRRGLPLHPRPCRATWCGRTRSLSRARTSSASPSASAARVWARGSSSTRTTTSTASFSLTATRRTCTGSRRRKRTKRKLVGTARADTRVDFRNKHVRNKMRLTVYGNVAVRRPHPPPPGRLAGP